MADAKKPRGEFADMPQSQPIVISAEKEMELKKWWLSEATRAAHEASCLSGAVLIRRPIGTPVGMVLVRTHEGHGDSPTLTALVQARTNTLEGPEGGTLYLTHQPNADDVKAAVRAGIVSITHDSQHGPCTRTLLHMSLTDQQR